MTAAAAFVVLGPCISAPLAEDTMLPTRELITLGQGVSGNLASWAYDDGNVRKVKKLFIAGLTGFCVVRLEFAGSKTLNPTDLQFLVKIDSHSPGPQRLFVRFKNATNGAFLDTNIRGDIYTDKVVYTARAPQPFSSYVSPDGMIEAQVEVKQAGPTGYLEPNVSFEFANLVVTY